MIVPLVFIGILLKEAPVTAPLNVPVVAVSALVTIPPFAVIFPVLVIVLDVVKDVVPIPPFAVIFPVFVSVPLLLILVAEILPPDRLPTWFPVKV